MWNNILKITIDHTKVASDLTDFPVYVNLADLGASFFTDVKTDGSDIRVFDSATGLEVPYELVAIDTVLNTGELWFKGNLSSSVDTSFYIKYGNASASAYSASDTYGRNNVWGGTSFHLGDNLTGSNLITNPSFEVDLTGYNAYVNGGSAILPTLTRDTTEFYSGVASLKHTGSGASSYSGVRIQPTLVANRRYIITLKTKATAGNIFNLYVESATGPSYSWTQTGEWLDIKFGFYTSATNSNIYFRTTNDDAIFYIDDVSIYENTTVTDSNGVYNGTKTEGASGTSTEIVGLNGKAQYFIGTVANSAYIDTASNPALDTTLPHTYYALMKKPSSSTGSGGIIGKFQGTTNVTQNGSRMILSTSGTKVAYQIGNGTGGTGNTTQTVTSTNTFSDNQYTFVAGVLDGANIKVMMGETIVSAVLTATTPINYTGTLRIGRTHHSNGGHTEITIDEAVALPYALSDDHLIALSRNLLSPSTFYSVSPVSVLIDGIDKSLLIDWKSIKREQVLTKESDKLSFLLRKHNGQTYKPTVGDEVILTINATKEFGGYIVELQEDVEGRVEYIKCICKDYTHQLDRQLVSKTYEAMTVDDIIADLADTFATDITYTNVDCPTLIDSVTFNYLPISQCLQRLTDIVEGYDWYIDYNKDLHFFFSESVASSFDLTDTSGNYVYNSLALREDTHQLRNEVIVRGGLLTSTTLRTEYLSGDATKTVFPLATKFANLPVVEISSVAKTVGIENIDVAGFDCYWNYNEKSLKFTVAPASGTSNITVTEYPQYPLILQKRNEESVTAYGLFQTVIVDKNIRDLETAGLRADVELLKYSEPEKTADFLTYTSGLMTGQTINIQSTIRGIDQDYKIQSIRSTLKTPDTGELVHEVSCITAEDLGINDILARLLIKNPSDQIQIQADEFVERIRQFTETFTIVDNTPTATEVTGPFLYGTAMWGFSTYS
jgi:hypothetical protein